MCYFNSTRLSVCFSLLILMFCVYPSLAFADAPLPEVKNPLYIEECGACHWPFLPGLLPERSWNRLLDGLKNHFGEDASLEAETVSSLREYLTQNSADKTHVKRSQKIVRSLSFDKTPLRVTEIPYIIHKHRELRSGIYKSPSVKSFSNCASCHPKALKGDFEEDSVRMPESSAFYSKGEVLKARISLAEAVRIAQAKYPGRFREAEMEHGLYEVKLVTNNGYRVKVFIDPVSGKILDNSYGDGDNDD